MSAFSNSPAALRLFCISILARLPLAMLTIGVLVHVEARTGSFAIAGLAGGALAIAQAVGGPWLGRVVDRRGQTAVLLGSSLACGGALVVLALLPGTAVAAVLLTSAALGFATPPVPACFRTLLPTLVADDMDVRRAYAVDSAAVELTWISGPPLVLIAGVALGTGGALIAAAGLLVASTLLFALAPASRAWRPASEGPSGRGGALRSGGVRTLVLALGGAGLLFGATEVAFAAAAESQGSSAGAGPLLALWGCGGFLGGLAVARAGGGARSGAGLALLLGGLAGAHGLLAMLAASPLAFGAGAILAGGLIAPTCASAYALVERVAADGTVTEAFAWMATAVALGTSVGAGGAGAVADAAGPETVFVLAALATTLIAALIALRAGTLQTAPAVAVAAPATT